MTSAGEHAASAEELPGSQDVAPAQMQAADGDSALGPRLSSTQRAPTGGNLGSRKKKAVPKELVIFNICGIRPKKDLRLWTAL